MTYVTYNDLNAETMQLYQEQRFSEAYDLLTREGERFPDEGHLVLYLRSCMAARTGETEHALEIIKEALDKGYWYGEEVVRQSPSWQPLQGLPEFELLATISIARQAAAQTAPTLMVEEPQSGCGDADCPLLMVLHGNGDNGTYALRAWSPAAAQGWLVASLQSSQVTAYRSYVWDDQETALPEVEEHYKELIKEYRVDKRDVVIVGFSMGGETALRASLNGTVPARGFILLGPGGPTIDAPEGLVTLIKEANGRGLRGYILVGEADVQIEHEPIRKLVELLNSHGIPCKLETLPDIRHEYPRDFAPSIKRALAFVRK